MIETRQCDLSRCFSLTLEADQSDPHRTTDVDHRVTLTSFDVKWLPMLQEQIAIASNIRVACVADYSVSVV